MKTIYNRAAEDVGNIVEFGHVNIQVPDQRLATLFYITGLGLTRDPYLVTGVENMWVNVGTTQFHLPTGPAQALRGEVVIAMPDISDLLGRLKRVAPMLAGTQFAYQSQDGAVTVVCPWGNRMRLVPATSLRLGIVAVALDAAPGAAEGIARFYREVFASPASVNGDTAMVPAGLHTQLIYREAAHAMARYDGAHIQIGVANFSTPHAQLLKRGLITEESNQHQYRFQDVIDLDSGAVLATIEHEVRSMRHPMYARPLINRDPAITNQLYAIGREPLVLGANLAELQGSGFL